MLCPRCGSQVPDDVRSCPKCGAILAIDSPPLASTDVAKDLPEQERRVRAVLIAVVVALVGVWFALSVARRINRPASGKSPSLQSSSVQAVSVVAGPVSLKSRGVAEYPFDVPSGCRNVSMESSVDTGADAAYPPQMLIFDDAGFAAWKRRQPARAIYSGKITSGVLEVRLPSTPGHYHLVFTTGPSTIPKVVRADVRLNCYR
jgi:zinc-ribbon domain